MEKVVRAKTAMPGVVDEMATTTEKGRMMNTKAFRTCGTAGRYLLYVMDGSVTGMKFMGCVL